MVVLHEQQELNLEKKEEMNTQEGYIGVNGQRQAITLCVKRQENSRFPSQPLSLHFSFSRFQTLLELTDHSRRK